jgi:hypothetical protein
MNNNVMSFSNLNLLTIGIQCQLKNHHQVHFFLVIMLSLIFEMVYFIMMVFCMFLMAFRNFKFFKLGMMFW